MKSKKKIVQQPILNQKLETMSPNQLPSTQMKQVATQLTHKQELEALHQQMVKYGIHSIGQLEVKISQL